ncbi:MAG: hypothetical protein ACRD22_11280, partial [Terriglobia bacterium]
VDQFEIRSRWQPVRRWSIKIEVSNMTMPLTVSRKGKLARVLFHQFLELTECYDFPKRSVNGFGARFHGERRPRTWLPPSRCVPPQNRLARP